MQILRVISSMNPIAGGPCQGIRNSVPYLQKLGIQNDVVCLDNSTQDYGIDDLFTIYKLGQGKTSYQYHPQLVDWLLENSSNYDVIIVHGLWQYSNLAVYKAIKKIKKQNLKVPKTVVMPHGMLDPYFQQAPERKWKALRNELIWRFIEKKGINTADALFFTCEEELLLARTTFKGYCPKKEINVGYGIETPPIPTDLQKQVFRELLPSLQNRYWLFLSRIHPKKGVDLLIEAYNQLSIENKELPDLVIAGPTDSFYAQQMIKKAESNCKIHFPGMLKGDAKWGAFYGCDLYLLPSHQENFGISIVEAMACHKPVLITQNINIWREIISGKGGWVLEDLGFDTIRNEMKNISQMNSIELEQLGEQAYKTFLQKFSIEERASVFMNTLKELEKNN